MLGGEYYKSYRSLANCMLDSLFLLYRIYVRKIVKYIISPPEDMFEGLRDACNEEEDCKEGRGLETSVQNPTFAPLTPPTGTKAEFAPERLRVPWGNIFSKEIVLTFSFEVKSIC